jgi:hypothetical protein
MSMIVYFEIWLAKFQYKLFLQRAIKSTSNMLPLVWVIPMVSLQLVRSSA